MERRRGSWILLSSVQSQGRGNGHTEVYIWIKLLFYCESDQIVAQVAQRGSGISICEVIKNPWDSRPVLPMRISGHGLTCRLWPTIPSRSFSAPSVRVGLAVLLRSGMVYSHWLSCYFFSGCISQVLEIGLDPKPVLWYTGSLFCAGIICIMSKLASFSVVCL